MGAFSCVFTYKLDIIVPHPFTDGANILEFSNLQEFDEKIEFILNSPHDVINIVNRGREHLMAFHTSHARVAYLLQKIEGQLINQSFVDTRNLND